MKEDMRKMLEEHINKQAAKRDDPMDETDASSFSPPPPQPPGAPRIIRERSRSRQPNPIIKEVKPPSNGKGIGIPVISGKGIGADPVIPGKAIVAPPPEPEKIIAIEDKKDENHRGRSRSRNPIGRPAQKKQKKRKQH